MEAILVDRLVKRYGTGPRQVEALRGVSLRVAPGEIYGLLGRNGAGKTTLVRILLDLVRSTEGEARLLGKSTRDSSTRGEVGYLPEDHRFPDYQTGTSALHFYGMLSGLPRRVRVRRAAELLETVGLEKAAGQKVRGYSKGMKQRLGLAQALIHEPKLLFLDEPTDGVDPVGRAEIRAVLERLKHTGTTVFLNSHLLSEVERLCDRVAILDRGALVREGTVEELTRGDSSIRLSTIPALDDVTQAVLAKMGLRLRPVEDGFELSLQRSEDIDRVVDLLRERNISIRALVPKRFSLEEVFLKAVQEVGGAAASSTGGVA